MMVMGVLDPKMNYIVGDPQIELKWGLKWAKSMDLGETLKVK